MFDDPIGPIEHFSWGKFVIKGTEHSESDDKVPLGVGKDICVRGEVVVEWKERKGHNLTITMVELAIQKPPVILVIGIGVQGLLQCPEKVRDFLISRGIEQVICLRTPLACEQYNRLYHQGVDVMLLAHGTC